MRPEKQLLLNAVKTQMESAPDFVLTSYKKMDANLTFEFRRAIRESGGFLHVVKKRVFLKAAIEAGLELDHTQVPGHLGIVHLSKEMVTTAKVVYDYKRDYSDMLEILCARVEGQNCSPQEVEEISKLPNLKGMRSELLGVFAASASQIVCVIQSLLSAVVHCIEGKIQKEKPK